MRSTSYHHDVWGTDSRRPQEPCIRWDQDFPREEAILGVVRPIEKRLPRSPSRVQFCFGSSRVNEILV